MNAAEVVVGEVQAVCRPQVLPLLREGICQPGETAHAHADRQVRALNVRRANLRRVRVAHDWDLLRVRDIGRAVPAPFFLRGLGVDLHELGEVATVAQRGGDRRDVRLETVGTDLELLRRSRGPQAFNENVRGGLATPPQGEVQNQLSAALDGNEAIRVANAFVVMCIFLCTFVTGATAGSIQYNLIFSGGSPTPTSGSFTYNTTTASFTQFDVVFDGRDFNLIPSANSPVTHNYQICPVITNAAGFFGVLTGGGSCGGSPLVDTWAVYPPNPAGGTFNTSFNIGLFTSTTNAGYGIGGNWPDTGYVHSYTSGTFSLQQATPEPSSVILVLSSSVLFLFQKRRRT